MVPVASGACVLCALCASHAPFLDASDPPGAASNNSALTAAPGRSGQSHLEGPLAFALNTYCSLALAALRGGSQCRRSGLRVASAWRSWWFADGRDCQFDAGADSSHSNGHGLNGLSLMRRVQHRDPQQSAAVFSANDRSTLELDLRRRRPEAIDDGSTRRRSKPNLAPLS
jgi:hypothetical protein